MCGRYACKKDVTICNLNNAETDISHKTSPSEAACKGDRLSEHELSFAAFRVLNTLRISSLKTQRDLAHASKLSLGQTNKQIKTLLHYELVEKTPEGFVLSHKGLEALKPYKVERAIIMAAGLSSRFAPLSYEKPKGLLKVRGEILIERQIRQLQAAGIHNITVVVGYKKEHFFYLKERFVLIL